MNITVLTAIEVRGGEVKKVWTDAFIDEDDAEMDVRRIISETEGVFGREECHELSSNGKKAFAAVYPNGDRDIYVLS